MSITAKQLVEEFRAFLARGDGYVYGLQGERYTQELARRLHQQAKDGKIPVPGGRNKNRYFVGDCDKWIGYYVSDCSGGIVAAMRKYNPSYVDRSSYAFYDEAVERGSVKTIPEIPGLAVWRKGHIGLYVGGGKVIEFRGTDFGCVETVLKNRDFTHWLKLAEVVYNDKAQSTVTTSENWELSRLLKRTSPIMKGEDVRAMQRALISKGYSCGASGTDGQFGAGTESAVKAFQKANGLTADGIVGQYTCIKLGGIWKGGKTNAPAPSAGWTLSRLLKRTKPMTRGEDVRAAQKVLLAQGYSCGNSGADGAFGDGTRDAVKRFQKANGLKADGIIGKDTCAKLGGKWNA